MSSRLATARRRFRRRLTPEQRRGVRVLAWASVVSLAGLSLTGIWQFLTHESNPGWYGYDSGLDIQLSQSASEGGAELHSIFATAVAAIALIGGAWFAYRVLYDIPWAAVAALMLALTGLVSGSVIRFNLVKLEGREFEEAGVGYRQIFGRDLEFVVTDRFELGPLAIRLWTVGHLLILPVMLIVFWLSFPVSDETPDR